eukprot:scaffold229273_cov19-Tisochrysis_lutea.AAC.1
MKKKRGKAQRLVSRSGRCAQIWTDVYKCYISSCSARCAQHDMAGMIEMMHLNGAGKVCGMM